MYCRLETNRKGKGLIARSIFIADCKQVLPASKFVIPAPATPQEASFLLAVALTRLGWGPEVDQRGRITERSEQDDRFVAAALESSGKYSDALQALAEERSEYPKKPRKGQSERVTKPSRRRK